MTSVSVRAAKKAFNGNAVLRGVDFALEDGGIAALLGPSGCGKTTLLRLIAGFERLDGGEIVIGGETVAGARAHVAPEKRRVGYVPQEGALFPHLTVAGNVGFGLPRRERSGPRVAEVLKLVGVGDLGDRYPHQLSGGQQQRVALARALAPNPRIIVLDEPFNGLDLDLRRAISAEVVGTLRAAGASAILVTHDPEEAFASADVVAVMHDGLIAQQGAPAEVYMTPDTPKVAKITGAAVFLDATLRDGFADTALGPIAIGATRRWVNGAARVCLRPGQIVIAANGAGRPATVTAASFRGDHSVLTVAIGDVQLPVRAPAGFTPAADGVVAIDVAGSCVAFAPGS